MSEKRKRGAGGVAREVFSLLGRTLLVFLVLEGALSTFHVLREVYVFTKNRLSEVSTSQYDPELGWWGAPNLEIPDAYGPGADVIHNSLGLRSEREYEEAVPEGKTRIVCSGDSFTWGVGVGNQHTWVKVLEDIGPGVEAINMGHNAYGLDQAYLLYRREGKRFDHDIHLFTFVGVDFDRLRKDGFFGMSKPKLKIEGGELQVTNVPTPRASKLRLWWEGAQNYLLEFRSMRVLLFDVLFNLYEPPPAGDRTLAKDDSIKAISVKVIEELARLNEEKGSTLVLIYLPTASDYQPNPGVEEWRRFLRAETAKRNIHYIDLISSFRKLPPSLTNQFFIPKNPETMFYAGHYTEQGHQHFAGEIYRRLCQIPEAAVKLNACEAPSTDCNSGRVRGQSDPACSDDSELSRL